MKTIDDMHISFKDNYFILPDFLLGANTGLFIALWS